MGAFGGVPPQGIPPTLGQQMMASLIAQQAALQQPSISANMAQGGAANVPPSQPGYQAGDMGTGQLPPGMAFGPAYTQNDLRNVLASSQNAIARPPTQVICNLLAVMFSK